MSTDELKMMFATADDLKNAQPQQAIDKARYYITAWLRSEWLKRFVYELQSPLFAGRDLHELSDVIQNLVISEVKKQDLNYHTRQKYISDIIQACNVCRKKTETNRRR